MLRITSNLLIIITLSFFAYGMVFASDYVHPNVFTGGYDEDAIIQCSEGVLESCQQVPVGPEYFNCIEKQMRMDEQLCKQCLSFLDQENGFIADHRLYGDVMVINALVAAADHSQAYFMVDNVGTEVALHGFMDISKQENYQAIADKFPDKELLVWPEADAYPKSYETADGLTLIFEQKIHAGCKACAIAGTAQVAYLFDQEGNYKSMQVEQLIPTKS